MHLSEVMSTSKNPRLPIKYGLSQTLLACLRIKSSRPCHFSMMTPKPARAQQSFRGSDPFDGRTCSFRLGNSEVSVTTGSVIAVIRTEIVYYFLYFSNDPSLDSVPMIRLSHLLISLVFKEIIGVPDIDVLKVLVIDWLHD